MTTEKIKAQPHKAPVADDEKNSSFFLRSLGETTRLRALAFIVEGDYEIKFVAKIVGHTDVWESPYVPGKIEGSSVVYMPVSFLVPHNLRRIDLTYIVKNAEGETPSLARNLLIVNT
jgi:hypothetical protein